MFDSPREALQTMYKKREGRGIRSQTYTDRVTASFIPDSISVRLARLIYGERGVARAPMDFPAHPGRWGEWADDLTLQTWCFNRCYLCGDTTVYGDDHRCARGPCSGKLFWTPARKRVVENTKKWFRRRLRAAGLMRPPVKAPKTVRRPVLEGDEVQAFDEDRNPVLGHGIKPPTTIRVVAEIGEE